MEQSGQVASSTASLMPPAELRSRLESAIRGETTLFPIIVKSVAEDANLARVLTLSRNVGIRRTYVSFRLPQGKKSRNLDQEKADIMWRLKAICEPINARYSAVSSRVGRFLICVSYSNPIIKSEPPPLVAG